MAHVQFRTGSAVTNGHESELIVDGVDITTHVLAEGFSISESDDPDPLAREWVVKLTLAADTLDVDLPDAVLAVTREEQTA